MVKSMMLYLDSSVYGAVVKYAKLNNMSLMNAVVTIVGVGLKYLDSDMSDGSKKKKLIKKGA